jgi:hypothetical protein
MVDSGFSGALLPDGAIWLEYSRRIVVEASLMSYRHEEFPIIMNPVTLIVSAPLVVGLQQEWYCSNHAFIFLQQCFSKLFAACFLFFAKDFKFRLNDFSVVLCHSSSIKGVG